RALRRLLRPRGGRGRHHRGNRDARECLHQALFRRGCARTPGREGFAMKLVSAEIHTLKIPFVESFVHSIRERHFSDSIVVMVRDESGLEGFGEGAPREYVTGESHTSMIRHLTGNLWPMVVGRELTLDVAKGEIPEFVAPAKIEGAISDGASRCALELAILDLALKLEGSSLVDLLPPYRPSVLYSGVITAGRPDRVARLARQLRLIGLRHVKVKVGTGDDVERVRIVRETMGPAVTIRVDANGAWSFDQAVAT